MSSSKEQTSNADNHKDVSQKRQAERKKPDAKEHALSDYSSRD